MTAELRYHVQSNDAVGVRTIAPELGDQQTVYFDFRPYQEVTGVTFGTIVSEVISGSATVADETAVAGVWSGRINTLQTGRSLIKITATEEDQEEEEETVTQAQTELTVAENETQYGFNDDEPVGAVNPATAFGETFLYLYGDTFDDMVVLKFAGGVKVSGADSVEITLSGAGLPPGEFSATWNAVSGQYDVLHAGAVLYLSGQDGNDVTVDLETTVTSTVEVAGNRVKVVYIEAGVRNRESIPGGYWRWR